MTSQDITSKDKGQEQEIDRFRIDEEPYYVDIAGEVALFELAARNRLAVMLKGPTGCGKTRFVQHMAYRLRRPLITVACHEDHRHRQRWDLCGAIRHRALAHTTQCRSEALRLVFQPQRLVGRPLLG